MRALFIHDPHDLDALIPGGVQICTRDFLEVVTEASSAVELFPVHVSRNLWWRIRRRAGLGSYLLYRPSDVCRSLQEAFEKFHPTHVFLNRTELLRLAPLVRELSGNAKVVILSHGNQSGDDLYEVSGPGGRRRDGLAHLVATWKLGSDLITESSFRHQWIDVVCVMSGEEEILERWLGAKSTVVIPRLVRSALLEWHPTPMRVGFVGTLDHTPNRTAISYILNELMAFSDDDFEFRLVGGPLSVGEAFAEQYPFVSYLGMLSNEELRAEVSSWSLFLNPIFWLSRGASMKLGQAIAWGLPSLSTRSGVRGYQLLPGQVIVSSDTVTAFVSEMQALLSDLPRLQALRNSLLHLQSDEHSLRSLGMKLRSMLE
jgi:glycosyltransferase involved in cell wall biosynthesis